MSTASTSWKQEVENAARGVLISIYNQSPFTFTRTKFSISSGIWSQPPPEIIPPRSNIEFGTSSQGFMTGTEGYVFYSCKDKDGSCHFFWSNPFIGTKYHNFSASPIVVLTSANTISNYISTQLYTLEFTMKDSKIGESSLSTSLTNSSIRSDLDFSEDEESDLRSFRTVLITVENTTMWKFHRKVYTLDRGKWVTLPPETIEPRTTLHFSTSSDSMAIGTSGRVFYTNKDGEEFEIYWNNPFVSESEFEAIILVNPILRLGIETLIDEGSNAHVTFKIINTHQQSEKSRPSTPGVEPWTTKTVPAVDCSICSLLIEDRQDYCNSCYKIITEQTKINIINKLNILKKLQEENKELQDKILVEEIKKREEKTREKVKRDVAVRNIKNLKEKIHVMDLVLKKDRIALEQLKARNLQRKQALSQAQSKLGKAPLPQTVVLDKDIKKAFEKLGKHRKYLIAEILSFFPVNPHSETECAILNIKLPNLSGSWLDLPVEPVATALGYIVHLLNTTIGYLKVCLPYHMLYYGSRSLIWREGSPKKYLLYNNHTEDFRTAVEMLNWNVVHLCISQNIVIPVDSHEQTLRNLLTVLRSPQLGMDGPPIEDWKRRWRGSSPKGSGLRNTNRRRIMSISSLAMPSMQTEEDVKENDEEEFVLVQTQLLKPSQSDELTLDSERAMFTDKV